MVAKEVKLFTSALKAFQCNNSIVLAQRKHLDDFLRGRIIGLLECGRTQLEVSEELGIAQSVISWLWQRFQDDGTVSRCYSTGRPRVTTLNEDRYIFGSYCQKKQTEHSIRLVSSALFRYRYDSFKADRVQTLRVSGRGNINVALLSYTRVLATDLVILNHGQVTRTTPELATPLLTTTPTGHSSMCPQPWEQKSSDQRTTPPSRYELNIAAVIFCHFFEHEYFEHYWYTKKNYLEIIHVHVFYNSYVKHFALFCNHTTPEVMYLPVYTAVFSVNPRLDIDSFKLVTPTTWLLWLHPFFNSTWKRSSLCNNSIVLAQRKHLDDFLRGRIIGLLECGRTQLEVSEELGIAQSVISWLWQRFQDDGTVSRCYSTGRTQVTTPNKDRYIYLAVTAKRNRRSTASDLSRQLSSATGTTVSRQTVYRRLGYFGLYARRPVICVPLIKTHCRLRLTWSREHAL
ncbi:HTH_Tnp_Tc3_2 domain-containing protein [Trichonephila clavipes]|nr:HTH_Tnp_Tc3_2 domain-containing protein [Trichonephila clavipes]